MPVFNNKEPFSVFCNVGGAWSVTIRENVFMDPGFRSGDRQVVSGDAVEEEDAVIDKAAVYNLKLE